MTTIVRVRTRTTEPDEYNDAEVIAERRVELVGAFVAPRTADALDADGRSGAVIGLDLFAPAGVDLHYTDRVEVDGVPYEIIGEPGVWDHPHTGWKAGVVAALKRGEG